MTSQKHFGRYLIVSELGRGAMGAVHLAKDPLIEREVAIKTLLFGVEFVRPEKLEVSGEQLPKVRTRFDAMEVRYEALEKKNDFGVVVNAKLMVTGPFPCQIVLRGDYDQGGSRSSWRTWSASASRAPGSARTS